MYDFPVKGKLIFAKKIFFEGLNRQIRQLFDNIEHC